MNIFYNNEREIDSSFDGAFLHIKHKSGPYWFGFDKSSKYGA